MAEHSNVHSFDAEAEWDDSSALDSTCPDCGNESVASYLDKFSTYEYCTNCDWSEDDGPPQFTVEPITRRDRQAEGA